jgi:membrane protein
MHGRRSGFVPRHVTGLPPFGYHFRRLDNQINNEVKNEELRQAMEIFVCMKRAGVSEIAARTWAEIRADDVLGRAAQLAYYFFLALFPFLIFVIASLSVFGNADRGRSLLFAALARLLPVPAFQLISNTFTEIVQSSGPLKISLGILASIWSASLGMNAMMDTLNVAYRVEETRSLLKQYLVAVAMTLGVGLVIVIATLSVIVGDRVARAFALPHLTVVAWQVTKWPLAAALLFFGFATIYYFAPNTKRRAWRRVGPGAIMAVLLVLMVSVGLRVYLHFSGSYNSTYGSLGGVIVLLLCFYLGGAAVLSGGALNGVLERFGDAPDSRRAERFTS